MPQILVADRISASSDRDEVWSKLPAGLTSTEAGTRRALALGEKNPLMKLSGLLDGFVDDEAFNRMVKEFSGA